MQSQVCLPRKLQETTNGFVFSRRTSIVLKYGKHETKLPESFEIRLYFFSRRFAVDSNSHKKVYCFEIDISSGLDWTVRRFDARSAFAQWRLLVTVRTVCFELWKSPAVGPLLHSPAAKPPDVPDLGRAGISRQAPIIKIGAWHEAHSRYR